jgi:chemotaxis protein methyltransferase CheR
MTSCRWKNWVAKLHAALGSVDSWKNIGGEHMPISPASFAFVRQMLADHSAIALADDKAYLVESRLNPVAREAGCQSIDELVQRIRSVPDDDLQQRVIEAMTTNETSFFRDKIPFETLRDVILPDLFERRANSKRLHIWSAGCSAGQEPYSLAMLLREDFADLQDWTIRVIGSDLSAEVLDKARSGRFTQVEVERGLPNSLLQKYFRRLDTYWQLDGSIREMVEFRQFNLHGDWPAMPAMDIILLRNVMVYFDVSTRRTILGKVRQVMRPDGYLLLGGAETALHVDHEFRAMRGEGFSFYQLKST